MKKIIVISFLTLIFLSATAFSAGDNKTNNFTVNVICHDPIFIPTSNTLTPQPNVVAGEGWKTFTSNNMSTFYFEGSGNHSADYTVTITAWDQSVTIGSSTYELDVLWSVSDDLNWFTNHSQPTGVGSTFMIDPVGDACNAQSAITIKAVQGRASANSPAISNGVPFVFMMSAIAN